MTEQTQHTEFNKLYMQVRKKENRLLEDHLVKMLPRLPKSHPLHSEWKLRQKSSRRFIRYLQSSSMQNILEIGCGNGWFSHQCAKEINYVLATDIGTHELNQAKRVFSRPNLTFKYFDLNQEVLHEKFDAIVFNASIQYFKNFENTIHKAISHLNPHGEIHILDSPFYRTDQISEAKSRSKEYFSRLNMKEAAHFYYHHNQNKLTQFEVLYRPIKNKLLAKLFKDIPFGWYCLRPQISE